MCGELLIFDTNQQFATHTLKFYEMLGFRVVLLDGLLTDSKVAREFEFAPLRQAYMDPARVQGLKCRRDLDVVNIKQAEVEHRNVRDEELR